MAWAAPDGLVAGTERRQGCQLGRRAGRGAARGSGSSHGTGNLQKDLGLSKTSTTTTVSLVDGAPLSLDCRAGCVAAVDGSATGQILVSKGAQPPGGFPQGILTFARARGAGPLAATAKKAKRHLVRLVLHTQRFTLPAGKRRTILVRFPKRANTLFTFILKHGGSVTARLTVKSSLDPGKRVRVTVRFTRAKHVTRHHK